MTTVLFLRASPNGARSASGRIAQVFLDAYLEKNPHHTVHEISLFAHDLPEFGTLEAQAKFAPIFREEVTPEQTAAWSRVTREIDILKAADKIVLATPMWNLGIPYKLKQYFDVVVQPRHSFGYDPERKVHIGLLADRPVQLILTRSSTLPGDFSDFQLPYLKYIFEFIGIHDVRALCAWQTTKPTQSERDAYVASFFPAAREAGRAF